MVTVDGGGNGGLGEAGGHELEDGHLGGSVLASNAVGAELQVRDTTLKLGIVGVVEVTVDNLLSEGKGALETKAVSFGGPSSVLMGDIKGRGV